MIDKLINVYWLLFKVGSDGSKSHVRQLAGIETTDWKYPQNPVICTVEHILDKFCASQWFLPNGPIALLPVGDKFSNIVWSMSPEKAEDRKSMSDINFVNAVDYALDDAFGPHPGSCLLGNGGTFFLSDHLSYDQPMNPLKFLPRLSNWPQKE